jgi:hypothetical protein
MMSRLLFTALSVLILSAASAQTILYVEDFEAGPAGWSQSGTNSSWVLDVPAATFINSAGSGTKSWVTGSTGPYSKSEFSFCTSPLFDFSSYAIDPVLEFKLIHETEWQFDIAYVDVSIDSGANWNKLGSVGSGVIRFGPHGLGTAVQPTPGSLPGTHLPVRPVMQVL